MQQYLKIVGNGQRTMRDLTPDEAQAAMELIMQGRANEVQMAAFMASLRIKEESGPELLAFTQVTRRYSQQAPVRLPHSIDLCVPYNGRTRTPLFQVASAILAATCGAYVGLHGRIGQNTPPKFGVGAGDVLKALGVPVDLPLEIASDMLQETHLAFVGIEQFAPQLEALHQMRVDYGMRSFFNTVEKLLNPFNAETAIIGIFHYPVMQRVAEIMRQLDYARGLAVQGQEGAIDVVMTRRTPIMEFTQRAPELREWVIDPQNFGWWDGMHETPTVVTPQNQAALTHELLKPTPTVTPTYRRNMLLTAAMMLYAAGLVTTLQQGLTQAQNALASGRAQQHLESLHKEANHA
jgi:anthranilate phosphoribosyltransferase